MGDQFIAGKQGYLLLFLLCTGRKIAGSFPRISGKNIRDAGNG
jgi:hypothetical protein